MKRELPAPSNHGGCRHEDHEVCRVHIHGSESVEGLPLPTTEVDSGAGGHHGKVRGDVVSKVCFLACCQHICACNLLHWKGGTDMSTLVVARIDGRMKYGFTLPPLQQAFFEIAL